MALSGGVPGSAVATTRRRTPSGPHPPKVASAARQVSACPSRNVRTTACQSPGSSGPSQASAPRASTGVCTSAARAQVPRCGRSAITNGSPASASSPRNPSWSPYALSATTARNENPAARAVAASAAPICSYRPSHCRPTCAVLPPSLPAAPPGTPGTRAAAPADRTGHRTAPRNPPAGPAPPDTADVPLSRTPEQVMPLLPGITPAHS